MTAMAALMTIAVDMDGKKRFVIVALNKFTSSAKFKIYSLYNRFCFEFRDIFLAFKQLLCI